MIKRPDFSLVKHQGEQLQQAYSCLQRIVLAESQAKESLVQAAYEIYLRSVEEAMAQIPVDRLGFAVHEVPVDRLKKAGYENCLQVWKAENSALRNIDGIEEIAINRVRTACSEAWKTAQKRAKIRLSMDHRDAAQDRLVRELDQYLMAKDTFAQTRSQLQKYKQCIENYIPGSQTITSTGKWLFASKKDKEYVSRNADLVAQAYRADLISCSGRFQNVMAAAGNVTTAEAWQAYAANVILFTTALESFLDEAAEEAKQLGRTPKIPREPASSDMLPTEIADQVEAFSLDTSRLNATLRNYQDFGTRYMLSQQRVLLGDEMGLGKTVQAIGAMSHLATEGATHFLVVCPASVLVNWCREIGKFTELKAWLLHGQDFADNLIAWYRKGGIAVTNFESLAKIEAAEMDDLPLSMLVVDEAHFVKNPEAKRSVSIKKMADLAEYAIFMTGTPLENNVKEMRNLINMLKTSAGSKLPDNAQQFERQACSIYLRRTREDVLTELPDKTETIEWCQLGKEEKKAYNRQVLAKNFMGMRQVSWDVRDLKDSSKASRLKEIVEEAVKDGRKVLVFSYFLDTLNKVKELLGEAAAGPIDGSVPTDIRQEIIDEFSASETQQVLVCQSISGGTGLNIQSASVVVFCEPQIKPSIETQAIARAYRMGQAHDVLVYRLLADDTVDERIKEILEEKQQIFDTYAERSLIGTENLKRIRDNEESPQTSGDASQTSADAPQTIGAEKDAGMYQKQIIDAEIERIQAEAENDTGMKTEAELESLVGLADPKDNEAEQAEKTSPRRKTVKRRSKTERAAEYYPDGELIPPGTYTVGETLQPGVYFIRVQDSREKAAEAEIFASEEAMNAGQTLRAYAVDEARKIELRTGEWIRIVRADLVSISGPKAE